MPERLAGRIALVTGASSGLGRAICLAYAAEGARVCCVDMYESPRNRTNAETGKADHYSNRIEGETTVQEIRRLHGDSIAHFIEADVMKADDVQSAVLECVEAFGRLDIMVNNAGISRRSLASQTAWGVFLGCKYAITQMLKQDLLPGATDRGWIINTASVQSIVAYHNTPAYTASKGAVAQLTKQVALDYAPHRIHCNAISPGFLRTVMTQNLQNDPASFAEINKAHPFGGMGRTEDVAKAAVFLASDDASWITGVNLPVDGGYTIM
ncbi:hypothetical protein LTR74_009657 [Friedmanniomyces endolithicus]|nr:hypothetical protein LTR74_009657 [Friedmanniomyces endolithicus]